MKQQLENDKGALLEEFNNIASGRFSAAKSYLGQIGSSLLNGSTDQNTSVFEKLANQQARIDELKVPRLRAWQGRMPRSAILSFARGHNERALTIRA